MKKNVNKKPKLTVSWLAREAGLGVSTVRYYQKRGLVQMPTRPAFGGFRTYGQEHLERLAQIRRAQELGFTLREIRELLACLDQQDCDLVKSLVERKRQAIKVRIRELKKVEHELATWSASCCNESRSTCPLLNKLFRSRLP